MITSNKKKAMKKAETIARKFVRGNGPLNVARREKAIELLKEYAQAVAEEVLQKAVDKMPTPHEKARLRRINILTP